MNTVLNFNPFSDPSHQSYFLPGAQGGALLIHGFPGTPAELIPLGAALNQAGWAVHGLLLPGFGAQFDSIAKYTARDWVGAGLAALQELKNNYQRTLLVGYSMGGGVSIQVAARLAPDRLVLLAPFWQTNGWFWLTLSLFKHIFPTIKPFRIFKVDFSNPESRSGLGRLLPDADFSDPQVVQAVLNYEFPLGSLDELRKVGVGASHSIDLVQCPTLIIQGVHDDWVRLASTRQLIQRLPGPIQYLEVDRGHDLLNQDGAPWLDVRRAVIGYAAEMVTVD